MRQIQGFLIGSLLAASLSAQCSHPEDRTHEILQALADLRSEVAELHAKHDKLMQLIEQRGAPPAATGETVVPAAEAAPATPPAKSSAPAAKSRPQCAATTQKGTRCKRRAVEGGKYCWQHAASDSTEDDQSRSGPRSQPRSRKSDD